MAQIGGTDLVARIFTVLQENLPTEIATIDGLRGGEASPAIACWLGGPRPVIDYYPAVTVDAQDYVPLEALGVDQGTPGRMQYEVPTEIGLHVQSTGVDTNRMRDIAERYLFAIWRVLLQKPGLETIADPTRAISRWKPNGNATPLDKSEQSSGGLVRSVRIPLIFWLIEEL